ncbi:MAG: hypothetical protein AB4063_08065 [Crocosphaera sp.]
MFNKKGTKPTQGESNLQEEWHISVIEILELDPWKYFKKPTPAYSKLRI